MKQFSEETRHKMSESAKARCTPEWRARRSMTLETPLNITEVRKLYESGLSQEELAQRLNVTQKVIWGFMRRHGLNTRPQIKRNQTGKLNSYWKADDAGYAALHKRVEAAHGRPQRCDVCGIEDMGTHYEWANLTGHYEDVDDYKRMCASCHRRYDNSRRKSKEVQNA